MLGTLKRKIPGIFLYLLAAVFVATGIKVDHDNHRAAVNARKLAHDASGVITAIPKVHVNPEYIRCLATNIYWEAAAEPFMGQVAVARVVVNRVKHGFASNPCRVIYQKRVVADLDSPKGVRVQCQFSWVCQGKGTPPRNSGYIKAEQIAREVLEENKWSDHVPGNVLFFHSTSVNPRWGYKKAMAIGNHIFYKK